MYVDVWIGLYKLWSSSPEMYRQLLVRERDQRYYVTENQHLPIRTVVTQIYRDGYSLSCTSYAGFDCLRRQGYVHDSRVLQIELIISDQYPLYSEILQNRGIGLQYENAREGMREGPGNSVFATGPLPRPNSTIVTSSVKPEVRG